METGEGALSTKKPFFLVREVKIPMILGLVLTAFWLFVLVRVFIRNPLEAIVSLVVGTVILSVVRNVIRKRTGQGSEEEDYLELAAAPRDARWTVLRRQMLTWQVWHLMLAMGSAIFLALTYLGVIV